MVAQKRAGRLGWRIFQGKTVGWWWIKRYTSACSNGCTLPDGPYNTRDEAFAVARAEAGRAVQRRGWTLTEYDYGVEACGVMPEEAKTLAKPMSVHTLRFGQATSRIQNGLRSLVVGEDFPAPARN